MSSFVALDWGTTNLRGYHIQNGKCIEKRALTMGILNQKEKDFFSTFTEITRGWEKSPVILIGMIGSRSGWREAQYVSSLYDIASNLVDVCDLLKRKGWLVPGLTHKHSFQDVMRGEETQLLGLQWDGLVLLPGTHNKYVWMQNGEVIHFRTLMTGEIYGLLTQQGMIAELIHSNDDAFNFHSFSEGVLSSRHPGGLLHQIFSVRARGLDNNNQHLADYLSGILIGSELESQGVSNPVLMIGEKALCERYEIAIENLYPKTKVCFESGQDAIIRGASHLWEKINE